MMNDPFIYVCAYLYVICAIHQNCPMLLIVYIWPRLPQLFGLVPLPVSCLYVCEQKHKEGVRLAEAEGGWGGWDEWSGSVRLLEAK